VKLLLDTHIWLWAQLAPNNLVRRVTKAIESQANELWLSPISIWELVLLVEKRRVDLNAEVGAWVAQALINAPIREAPLTTEVALETRRIQLPHDDPADKFLVATARVFQLTLVTADTRLLASKTVPVLPNR
jgi:PIN domain nuclease of toxin-antitoxin system